MACASLLTDDNILRFRTKACLRLSQGSCSFGDDRCQYSHSQVWTRRSPYYASPGQRQERSEVSQREPLLRYLPVPCENLQIENGKVVKVKCPRGVNCPFSHSPEEIVYHPLVYKTEPCKAFAQRSCRVYYCWKSHGEKERRQSARHFSLGVVKGLNVPVNYPGVSLVELLPNKNGRRRRPRLPPASPPAVLESSGGSVASLGNSAHHENVGLLLHGVVRHLAECAPADAAWTSDCMPKAATLPPLHFTDDAMGAWPPLSSLLNLIEGKVDPEDVRPPRGCPAQPQGKDARNNLKSAAKHAAKKEGQNFLLRQGIPIEETVEELPLRRQTLLAGNVDPIGSPSFGSLKDQIDANSVESWGLPSLGEKPTDPIGTFPTRPSLLPLQYANPSGSSSPQANLFTGCEEFVPGDSTQLGETFGDCKAGPMHVWRSSNNFWLEGGVRLPTDDSDGLECSRASWSTPGSAHRSVSANMTIEDLKAGAAEQEGNMYSRGNGGDASLSSTCFSLDFTATGSNWSCTKQDLESVAPRRKGSEDSPLPHFKRDEDSLCQWPAAGWTEESWCKVDEILKAGEEDAVYLKGLQDLTSGNDLLQDVEDNKRLMSCFVSLLKLIQENESPEAGTRKSFKGNDCESPTAEFGVFEASQPPDETAESNYPHMMALWKMARLAA
ncbi:zinc finger (CCCH type) protein, putative [Eimeria necatrix]|uniref:Zinc finger (CCCH type) protein, putative n=1 Tax=Eimeria necatrix TaxID=51315 RepID=U6MLG3_9EIME|nr:zinc finger (CCCH type) protein, putative [Eimeria necatrix]CDJ63918.1 zinc finger (CCCH type) protein, putative [Eimeria necatrix]